MDRRLLGEAMAGYTIQRLTASVGMAEQQLNADAYNGREGAGSDLRK